MPDDDVLTRATASNERAGDPASSDDRGEAIPGVGFRRVIQELKRQAENSARWADEFANDGKVRECDHHGGFEEGLLQAIRVIEQYGSMPDLIALAEAQANQLAEIREQCVKFTPDPDLVAAIIAIIDGGN
jgi:hypothetical protein